MEHILHYVETDELLDPLKWEREIKEEFFGRVKKRQLEDRWLLMQDGPRLQKVLEAYKNGDEAVHPLNPWHLALIKTNPTGICLMMTCHLVTL